MFLHLFSDPGPKEMKIKVLFSKITIYSYCLISSAYLSPLFPHLNFQLSSLQFLKSLKYEMAYPCQQRFSWDFSDRNKLFLMPSGILLPASLWILNPQSDISCLVWLPHIKMKRKSLKNHILNKKKSVSILFSDVTRSLLFFFQKTDSVHYYKTSSSKWQLVSCLLLPALSFFFF